jgi:menaquinone-dependent protoporphyrinogen oxidase
VDERGAAGGAFFSVCGAASGRTPEGDREAEGYRERFLRETGWEPELQTSIAGAVVYTKYGPLTRFLMKRIQRAKGLDTDTSRDFEYTDWEDVDRFADAVHAALLPGSVRP